MHDALGTLIHRLAFMRDRFRTSARWMLRVLTTPGVLILFAFVVVVLGFLGPFWLSDKPHEFAVVMAAGAAIGGFFFNAAINFHAQGRDKAFKFIESFQKDRDLNDAFRAVSTIIAKTQASGDREAMLFEVSDLYRRDLEGRRIGEEYAELTRKIQGVGAFLEDMAATIKYKEVNEEILEAFFDGHLVRCYECFEKSGLLRLWRNVPPVENSPLGTEVRRDLLVNMEELYRVWAPRYRRRYLNKMV